MQKAFKIREEKRHKSRTDFPFGKGAPLSRQRIWEQMKTVCKAAKVEEGKVFPHNLRHLFPRTFYRETKDIVILGHTSTATTRIYLISTEKEHRSALESLKLVC